MNTKKIFRVENTTTSSSSTKTVSACKSAPPPPKFVDNLLKSNKLKKIALVIILFFATATQGIYAEDLTGTINTTSFSSEVSLETAIATVGIALDAITKIEITAGKFTTADWNYLENKSSELKQFTDFIITKNITSVADIPESTFGYTKLKNISVAKVSTIESYAFYDCADLRSANFPETSSIGESAFSYCKSLVSVNFLKVEVIGEEAFLSCNSLHSVNFPETNSIGKRAFGKCMSLVSVNFPKLKTTAPMAFFSCANLVSANFPLLEDIEDYTFGRCVSLTKLTLGSEPPKIGNDSFFACPPQRKIVFVDTTGAFLSDSDLETAQKKYKNDNTDGNNTDNFWHGWDISKTKFYEISTKNTTNGAIQIQKYGYYLEKIKLNIIPSENYTLKSGTLKAYKKGDKNTIVPISDDNEIIMQNYDITVEAEFETNMLKIVINGSTNKSGVNLQEALNGTDLGTIEKLKITSGSFSVSDWVYLQNNRDTLKKITDFIITDSITSVADLVNIKQKPIFNDKLKNISVAKLKNIDDGIFGNNINLVTVNFPQTEQIGEFTFSNCKALTVVNFPQVKIIGRGAFKGCISLTKAIFPKLLSLGDTSLYECKSLKEILLGSTPPMKGYTNGEPKIQIIFVDETGEYLSGDELKKAQAAYKNDDSDGSTADSLWYGWKISYILTTGISINETTKKLDVNEEFTLVATIAPDTATVKKVLWTSSDATKVSVDDDGKITGLKGGKATITATAAEGKHTATCEVTVGTLVSEVTLNENTKTLTVSEEFTLVATIAPTEATNKDVIWTSSDSITVSVDDDGKITGLKAGKATITATTDDGGHTATCEVTVEKNTALKDVDSQRVTVYPNPAKGAFTIKANDQYKLQISDISGKIITEKEITERTTVELPTGVYLLKFSNEKEVSIVKKVIVE